MPKSNQILFRTLLFYSRLASQRRVYTIQDILSTFRNLTFSFLDHKLKNKKKLQLKCLPATVSDRFPAILKYLDVVDGGQKMIVKIVHVTRHARNLRPNSRTTE